MMFDVHAHLTLTGGAPARIRHLQIDDPVLRTGGPWRSVTVMMNGPLPSSWSPVLRSILRIVAAFVFMMHGTQKLFAFPVNQPRETVELLSLPGLAGILEVFGGGLMLLGLFTRPVAFLLSGEMAAAYFMAHAPRSFWPVLNGGEPAVLYCFLFLYLAAAGPGPLSLDAIWRGRR
jgi:putative oxidoreductase